MCDNRQAPFVTAISIKPKIEKDAAVYCNYCSKVIDSDNFLPCHQCGASVHIKCLRHASTPGDLYGDVFFEFTCGKCMQLQLPCSLASSSSAAVAREKFVRQRLPWFLVITLAIYNLSIKSKGLSRQGFFHWRSHIANFIEKNWEYLFEAGTRRRKNWIGSISGNLSHNSPDFFLSGQEVFNEPGWWKLTYSKQSPKFVYKIYEQLAQKRQNLRNDRRLLGETAREPLAEAITVLAAKRVRRTNSAEDFIPADACSRTIPYMGRKPKLAKPLKIVNDDMKRTVQHLPSQVAEPEPEPPLNTVQSSLMDFLAENLGGDDLSMFQHLPNIAPEPLVETGGKDYILSLMDTGTNEHLNFFDEPDFKDDQLDLSNCDLRDKVVSAPAAPIQEEVSRQNSLLTASESSSETATDDDEAETDVDVAELETTAAAAAADDDYDRDEKYQPHIVQVTNYQQLNVDQQTPEHSAPIEIMSADRAIKEELKSEAEETDDEQYEKKKHKKKVEATDTTEAVWLKSLFTKRPRRKWPWLTELNAESDEDASLTTEEKQRLKDLNQEKAGEDGEANKSMVTMSEYEERELLHKMRKIFACEDKCQLKIPSYIRRFYRKLCVRQSNREHGRPIFDLDKFSHAGERIGEQERKENIIDRYQLISLSSNTTKKSFYARISGSCEYELFQSPYTQHILHPFIYRNKKIFPPWLKLMCEVQHAATGRAPQRAPIDFCYVRPNHIAAVNALLQSVFWPGIDMSECLSYPDYSVVALYKRLVVGCGFLVPDVGFNEAYISFMAVRPGWQRSGIGSFMLYHLIQTCMSKDITLHVSATNPAVLLYQKFGFKIEETILDFYEKYLPFDEPHSRHAFFLRLLR